MRGPLALALIIAAMSVAVDRVASVDSLPTILAQAGSTGGTIGKQSKSASGGEDKTSPPQETPARRPPAVDRSASREPAKSGCRSIAGTWSWTGGLFGSDDTVFGQDGSARHRSGIVGRWTCASSEYFIDWKNWTKGRLRLSPDGKQLISIRTGKVGFIR